MDDFNDLTQFTINAMRRSYSIYDPDELPSAIVPQFNNLVVDMVCSAYPSTETTYFFVRMMWLSDMKLIDQRKITPRWPNPKFLEALEKFYAVVDANPDHNSTVAEAGAEFLGTWARQ